MKVPRTKPLDKRELAICARLKTFRAGAGYPRRLFANHAGLDSSTIIRVELGRTPLRYEAARRICAAFTINPVWLATGKDVTRLWKQLPSAHDLEVDSEALFSEVFDTYLATKMQQENADASEGPPKGAETLNEHIRSLGDSIACMFLGAHRTDEDRSAALLEILSNPLPLPSITIEAAKVLAEALHRSLMQKKGGSAPPAWSAKLTSILEPGKLLYAQYQYVLKKAAEESKAEQKTLLTDAETSSKTVDVKAQLPNLLERLKKAAAGPGKKSELAKVLDVPLASVSRWLSGEREPGGEVALQLLHWCELQERKVK